MRVLMTGVFLAIATSALAFEGAYTGVYDGQSLKISKNSANRYSLSFEVSVPGCLGDVKLKGKAKGKSLIAVIKEDDNICTFTVTRTSSGVRVKEDNCFYYHGASCEFQGEYNLR